MPTSKPPVTIEVGQLWATKDRRDLGKAVRIVEIDGRHVVVEVETEPDKPRTGRSPVGRRSRVLYDHRGVRGYRLAETDGDRTT